jgi:hypothetical protein|nr:MAG TPA: hypothetical protein [Caudoviricetes sp.]
MYPKHLHLIKSISMTVIAHRFGYESTAITFDIGFKDYTGKFDIPSIKDSIYNHFVNNIFDVFDYDTKRLLAENILSKTRRVIFKVNLWCGINETFRYDIRDKNDHLTLSIDIERDINRWIKTIKVDDKAVLTLKFSNDKDIVKEFKLDHDNGYITLGDKEKLFKYIRKNIKNGDRLYGIYCNCAVNINNNNCETRERYSTYSEEVGTVDYDTSVEKGLCRFISGFIDQLYCEQYDKIGWN